jgi:hypothetical protein
VQPNQQRAPAQLSRQPSAALPPARARLRPLAAPPAPAPRRPSSRASAAAGPRAPLEQAQLPRSDSRAPGGPGAARPACVRARRAWGGSSACRRHYSLGPARQDAFCCRSSSQNRPLRRFLLTRRTNSSPVCPVFSLVDLVATSPCSRPPTPLHSASPRRAAPWSIPARRATAVVNLRSPTSLRPARCRRAVEVSSRPLSPFPPAQCRHRIRACSASRYAAEASSPPFSLFPRRVNSSCLCSPSSAPSAATIAVPPASFASSRPSARLLLCRRVSRAQQTGAPACRPRAPSPCSFAQPRRRSSSVPSPASLAPARRGRVAARSTPSRVYI